MTDPAELREPNLPASARRVAGGKLRKGWTTGTCSAAAAKAACLLLRDGDAPEEVQVPLARGEGRPSFACERTACCTAPSAGPTITSACVVIRASRMRDASSASGQRSTSSSGQLAR